MTAFLWLRDIASLAIQLTPKFWLMPVSASAMR